MKIEKVNDNQIRCTLTREDLANRELKISELAYGTEKAKSLFREMMKQASYEFGFEAEDIPLMIEAIPMSAECIVLIITKVEDPEELDTRFSRFTPSDSFDEEEEDDEEDPLESTRTPNDVLELFKRLKEDHPPLPAIPAPKNAQVQEEPKPVPPAHHVFRLSSLQAVLNAVQLIAHSYHSKSTLYKDEASDSYLLQLFQGDMTAEVYNKVCNTLTEYGQLCGTLSSNRAYLEEHYTALVADHAIESLSKCS